MVTPTEDLLKAQNAKLDKLAECLDIRVDPQSRLSPPDLKVEIKDGKEGQLLRLLKEKTVKQGRLASLRGNNVYLYSDALRAHIEDTTDQTQDNIDALRENAGSVIKALYATGNTKIMDALVNVGATRKVQGNETCTFETYKGPSSKHIIDLKYSAAFREKYAIPAAKTYKAQLDRLLDNPTAEGICTFKDTNGATKAAAILANIAKHHSHSNGGNAFNDREGADDTIKNLLIADGNNGVIARALNSQAKELGVSRSNGGYKTGNDTTIRDTLWLQKTTSNNNYPSCNSIDLSTQEAVQKALSDAGIKSETEITAAERAKAEAEADAAERARLEKAAETERARLEKAAAEEEAKGNTPLTPPPGPVPSVFGPIPSGKDRELPSGDSSDGGKGDEEAPKDPPPKTPDAKGVAGIFGVDTANLSTLKDIGIRTGANTVVSVTNMTVEHAKAAVQVQLNWAKEHELGEDKVTALTERMGACESITQAVKLAAEINVENRLLRAAEKIKAGADVTTVQTDTMDKLGAFTLDKKTTDLIGDAFTKANSTTDENKAAHLTAEATNFYNTIYKGEKVDPTSKDPNSRRDPNKTFNIFKGEFEEQPYEQQSIGKLCDPVKLRELATARETGVPGPDQQPHHSRL